MAAAAVDAGIPPLEVPAPAYNIPLNLTSILLMIPGSIHRPVEKRTRAIGSSPAIINDFSNASIDVSDSSNEAATL